MQIQHFIAGLSATIALFGATLSAQAQEYRPEYRGTYAEQMACTPDVFRLCGREIPDERRITACLRDNVPSLSRGCRAVIEPTTGSVQSAPQRPDRRDANPRDTYQRDRGDQRDRDFSRDRDSFNNDDPRRLPSYDNRRDRDDDD